jgi:dTDP-4-dehydrorhamnose reductase
MAKKILIPGVSGLLGLNLAHVCGEHYSVTGTVHQNPLINARFETVPFDFSSTACIEELVEQVEPDLIINCAAVANLDTSEKKPELARVLNTELPGKLAEIAKRMKIPFVHISTDAVFDGQKGLYVETDVTNPINTYAKTKLAGELAVQSANADAIIARVNFYGWSLSGNRSLCEFFYNHLKARKPLKGFVDLMYNPMMVSDLADTLLEMVDKKLSGIYHVSTDEMLSKYDFGCRLAEKFGFDAALIKPISWRDLEMAAVRSPNLTMDISKLKHALGHGVPSVADGLNRLKEQRENGYADSLQNLAGSR